VATPSRRLPRMVWLAVAVGLALRLGFALGYWVGQPLTHDEREYLFLARSLTLGHGFTYTGLDGSPLPGEHFGRAPVYPAALAALMAAVPGALEGAGDGPTDLPVAPRTVRAIRIVQAGLGALAVWQLAAIAGAVAGPAAAVAAACVAAVHPPLVWIPAFVFSETLFLVIALAAVRWMTPAAAPAMPPPVPSAAAIVGLGAWIGLGILVRPAMLFVLALAAAWWWWRRARVPAVLLVCAALAAVAPWSVRNTLAYGRFVAVASEGGITFWTGNHPLAVGDGDLAANAAMKHTNVAFRERHAGLTPEALEPHYYAEALQWMRANPGDWLALVARKAWYTVVPTGPSYRLHSARYRWGSIAPYLLLLALAVVGAARLATHGRLPAAVMILAGSTVLMSLVFFPQERFRIPTVDPALIVLAAGLAIPRRPAPTAPR